MGLLVCSGSTRVCREAASVCSGSAVFTGSASVCSGSAVHSGSASV